MNSLDKAEKEVLQARIKAEKQILKELEEQYKRALEEINDHIAKMLGSQNANLPHMIHRVEYQRMVKQQVQSALDKLHSTEYESVMAYLNDCYTDAFVGTVYTLHHQDVPVIVPIDQNMAVKAITLDTRLKETMYEEMGKDISQLKKTIRSEITRGISSGMMYSDIAMNLKNAAGIPMRRAKTIARTEAGRVQEQASHDAAIKAMSKGADLVKQWSAIRDGKTRDAHRMLDKQTKEMNEYFEINGQKALHPHDFGDPAMDCNCRCTTLHVARWALDEEELATMKERAAFFGIDKTDNINDFKKKYLGAEKEIKQAEEQNGAVTNKFGQVILFDKRLETEKWAESMNVIKQLAGEYDTRLTTVSPGAVAAAGTVDMGGAMRLSTPKPDLAVHEFAHSIAFTPLNKFKVEDHELFWKEIKSIKRAYVKDVGNDSARWISGYEHGSRSIDEFFAEAFAMAKGKQMGIQLPDSYGSDFTYANMVLEAVNKYFGKTKKH